MMLAYLFFFLFRTKFYTLVFLVTFDTRLVNNQLCSCLQLLMQDKCPHLSPLSLKYLTQPKITFVLMVVFKYLKKEEFVFSA